MRYKKISIQGFRGIKNCTVDNLSRINIFLGQNNTGKSTLLEAIFLLTGMNSQLILNIDLLRSLIHNEENDFRFIFYNLDFANLLEVTGEMHEFEHTRKFKIAPRVISQSEPIFEYI